MTQPRRRYAQVGIGSRSGMYTTAIVETYAEAAELVALCDVNQGRMDLANRRIADAGAAPVPTYQAQQFDRMIRETRPDTVIVTTVDATHSDYICRAMELGCDVITEKPMTTDAVRCRRILATIAETGRTCTVTFNYRYAPPRSQIKELLAGGAIGEILSVDFCWLLDTRHGADYFRRWHRRRANSGSLLVYKATHHFDIVNWWLEDVPETVFAFGSRRYYTPEMGEATGLAGRGERCHGCPASETCRFFLDLEANPRLAEMYLANEAEDGYFRDRCVFSPDITIWDTMTVTVRYRRGALLSYILHAYSPYEGYRISLNGTKGRLEHAACENTYVSGDGTVPGELVKDNVSITLVPAFAQPQALEVRTAAGGHGGGDDPLLADLFDPNPPDDPLGRAADHRDGAYSILIGAAACQSIDTGRPVRIADLLGDAPI